MSGFDYKEFTVYYNQLSSVEKGFKNFLEDFLLELALRAYAKAIERTPVRTRWLKDGWRLGEVQVKGNQLEIMIFNIADYAEYVEYGHRTVVKKDGTREWVEGQFMLTIALQDVEKEIPIRYKEKFNSYLKEHGLQ